MKNHFHTLSKYSATIYKHHNVPGDGNISVSLIIKKISCFQYAQSGGDAYEFYNTQVGRCLYLLYRGCHRFVVGDNRGGTGLDLNLVGLDTVVQPTNN